MDIQTRNAAFLNMVAVLEMDATYEAQAACLRRPLTNLGRLPHLDVLEEIAVTQQKIETPMTSPNGRNCSIN
ncbi:hypothetical protein [Agromyces sp. Leaf222]|uniref:hypothetical protein n=1 Tax=Agromyces sp. Leaf222 TaxID=1735688 RepID=UPI0006F8A208|nr:hypothetical protein [Agromyces sp. Leaf222]KQM82417.1 hypothetical protein ASE68_03215 [Agromyces sp. Leaf222]